MVAAGDWRLQFQIIEDIGRVTLADIERVRKAYFRPANRTVGRYLPSTQVERVEVPAAPPLQERLARLQGPPTVEQGEALDPSPPVLATRTTARRSSSRNRRACCDNNMRVEGSCSPARIRCQSSSSPTVADPCEAACAEA